MNKEIELLIKLSTLRDIEIKMREAQLEGEIVPDNFIEMLRDLEDEYRKEKEVPDMGDMINDNLNER